MKLKGQKKEGNQILRNLSIEGQIDVSQFSYELNNMGSLLMNSGKSAMARSIFAEASKLHIILSSYQRPVVTNVQKELEALPIWNVEENVGLTAYDEELTELTSFLPSLKQEALEAAKSVENPDFSRHWRVDTYVNVSTGNFIHSGSSGNLSTLSIFHFGKKRRGACKDLMPSTCAFFKKSFKRAATFKVGLVKLTVLDAGAKTLPVTGLTNLKLRILVPVQIPSGFKFAIGKDEEVDFSDEKWDVIDNSFEHSFDNEKGTEKAIWLSIDIPHPEFSAEEESKVSIHDFAKSYFLPF